MIGDIDPEDAYDSDDPVHIRLRVLEAVVAALLTEPDDGRREGRRRDALRVLDRLEDTFDELRVRLEAVRRALEGL